MAARSKKRVGKRSVVSAREKKSTKKASAPKQRSKKTAEPKQRSKKASARREPARSAAAATPERADIVYSDIRASMRAAIRRRFL